LLVVTELTDTGNIFCTEMQENAKF
jgi:hypothetical protein